MRRILRPTIYLTIALCILGAYVSVSNYARSRGSASWPSTNGVITDSDIIEILNTGDVVTGGTVAYQVFVKYRYKVEGGEFFSTTISFPNMPHFPDRKSAERYRGGYPVNGNVVVYHHPDKHRESCLERGGGGSLSGAVGGFLMFGVIAALCVYGLKIIPAAGSDHDEG